MPPVDDRERRLIAWLRSCYEAEAGHLALMDIFARSVERRRHLSGDELILTGLIDDLPIPDGTDVHKRARLYRRERAAIYATLFVAGRHRQQRLAAPLVVIPGTTAIVKRVAILRLDREAFRINRGLIDLLAADETAAEECHRALIDLLAEGPLARDRLPALAAALDGLALDHRDLTGWPHLDDEAALRAARRADAPRLIPAATVALVRLGEDTRGVKDELRTLCDPATPLSPALRALLGAPDDTASPEPGDATAPLVPAVLSAAQVRALSAVSQHRLSLVVGPPGTGKSFTIANLALDRLLHGDTVLVAARTDRAVDVIADKLHQLIGEDIGLLRAGRRHYARDLIAWLEALLAGAITADGSEDPAVARARLVACEHELAMAEKDFQRSSRIERTIGPMIEHSGVANRLRRMWWTWRKNRTARLDRTLDTIARLLDERAAAARAYLRAACHDRLQRVLHHHRRDLQAFLRSLTARSARKQAEYLAKADLTALFQAFPVVLVRCGDIADALPLRSGCFAVGIVDEATQCDLASSLPVLQRCDRAVVVGDPRQLRHVSFLSRDRAQVSAARAGLDEHILAEIDPRRHSLLDRCADHIATQDAVTYLDEHYRGLPDLIAFANHHFYHDTLRVMTAAPTTVARDANLLRPVAGQRGSDGVNRAEVTAVVEELTARMTAAPAAAPVSLGVVSPFRAQTEALQHAIAERFAVTSLDRHRLLVGTPYAFQGEERDVMLISLALDPASGPGSRRYLERPDVFNVMVTRARSLQLVFCSLDRDQLEDIPLLAAFLAHVHAVPTAPDPAAASDDAFLAAVMTACRTRGWACHPRFPVASTCIDLILTDGPRTLAVDLVGQDGQLGDILPLERYRMLARAGLRLIPLTYDDWHRDEEACLHRLAAGLERE